MFIDRDPGAKIRARGQAVPCRDGMRDGPDQVGKAQGPHFEIEQGSGQGVGVWSQLLLVAPIAGKVQHKSCGPGGCGNEGQHGAVPLPAHRHDHRGNSHQVGEEKAVVRILHRGGEGEGEGGQPRISGNRTRHEKSMHEGEDQRYVPGKSQAEVTRCPVGQEMTEAKQQAGCRGRKSGRAGPTGRGIAAQNGRDQGQPYHAVLCGTQR